jgi:hypothetical protein
MYYFGWFIFWLKFQFHRLAESYRAGYNAHSARHGNPMVPSPVTFGAFQSEILAWLDKLPDLSEGQIRHAALQLRARIQGMPIPVYKPNVNGPFEPPRQNSKGWNLK